MIRNLTYKQIVYLYFSGVVIAFIIIFKIALKPTIELKKSCSEKQEVLNSVAVAPQQIKIITDKLNRINGQLSSLSASGASTRDKILEEISTYCQLNNISVYNYPPSHFFDNKSFVVETNNIVIKGDFKRLLKLINYIETKGNFSRIISASFQSELNRKTKTKELYLELIFQNINNNGNNVNQ